MRSKVFMTVLIVALAWGLEQVVVSPLETGAAYPEYSSLRSDPMGTLALYESLGKVLKVDRLYKSRMRSDPGPGTTIFVLGVEPVGWAKLKTDTLKEYEALTAKGARLVIAFLPVSEPWKRHRGPAGRVALAYPVYLQGFARRTWRDSEGIGAGIEAWRGLDEARRRGVRAEAGKRLGGVGFSELSIEQ